MNPIGKSELILNTDGSIYHLNLHPEDIADTVIVVGDAGRVNNISKRFDRIELKKENREFVTHTGTLGGKRLTVLSTGIGIDNIDIVLNELDAIVNIDLKTRMLKYDRKSLNIIRLGTSGALQEDVPVDSFVASTHGVGIDGLLYFYEASRNYIEAEMTGEFIRHTGWSLDLPSPYIVAASDELLAKLGDGYIHGMTATAPGFYGPQGRVLRLQLAKEDLLDRLQSFEFEGKRITNFEMETSALFGLSKMLGHKAVTVCAIVANRLRQEFSNDYHKNIEKLISKLLDVLIS